MAEFGLDGTEEREFKLGATFNFFNGFICLKSVVTPIGDSEEESLESYSCIESDLEVGEVKVSSVKVEEFGIIEKSSSSILIPVEIIEPELEPDTIPDTESDTESDTDDGETEKSKEKVKEEVESVEKAISNITEDTEEEVEEQVEDIQNHGKVISEMAQSGDFSGQDIAQAAKDNGNGNGGSKKRRLLSEKTSRSHIELRIGSESENERALTIDEPTEEKSAQVIVNEVAFSVGGSIINYPSGSSTKTFFVFGQSSNEKSLQFTSKEPMSFLVFSNDFDETPGSSCQVSIDSICLLGTPSFFKLIPPFPT